MYPQDLYVGCMAYIIVGLKDKSMNATKPITSPFSRIPQIIPSSCSIYILKEESICMIPSSVLTSVQSSDRCFLVSLSLKICRIIGISSSVMRHNTQRGDFNTGNSVILSILFRPFHKKRTLTREHKFVRYGREFPTA